MTTDAPTPDAAETPAAGSPAEGAASEGAPTDAAAPQEPTTDEAIRLVLEELTQLKTENEALKADNSKLKSAEVSQQDLLKRYVMGRLAVPNEAPAPSAPAESLNPNKIPDDYFTRELNLI